MSVFYIHIIHLKKLFSDVDRKELVSFVFNVIKDRESKIFKPLRKNDRKKIQIIPYVHSSASFQIEHMYRLLLNF